MSAVFIHGVPDTTQFWTPVIQHLRREDAIALPLPGFDFAPDDNFAATKEAYVEWIVGEIEKLEMPVDLVGHDWGCILTIRVASLRPDLVRTWAGGGGPVSAAYDWHKLAKIFQTPGEGERFLADLSAAQLTERMVADGVPAKEAEAASLRVDARMKDAILKPYRSAVAVGAEWEPDLPRIAAPGLVLWGERDEPCPVVNADRLAAATGARAVIKLDAGHWFPVQQPEQVAQALQSHWTSAGSHPKAN